MASGVGVSVPATAAAEFEIAARPEHAAALLEREKEYSGKLPKIPAYGCRNDEVVAIKLSRVV